jgi:hypothetical protein
MNRESLFDILLIVGRVVGWLLIIAGNILFALGIAQFFALLFK